jgi:hypothetical protein
MIFHRRVLQSELDNLRGHLDSFVVDRLVQRLNRPNRERLSAMWETIILSALCELGSIVVERPTKSGRKPDVMFNGPINFVADITSISDQGLEDRNPVAEFSMEVERVKTDLGLPSGGLDYRIGSTKKSLGTGQRVDLRIPNRANISDFVQRRIAPEIKAQLDAGRMPIRIEINDEEAEVSLVIDPSKGPYSSGGYASFTVSGTKDRNPLAHALQRKAEQLRDADGLRGIFVCDTGSEAMRESVFGSSGFSPKEIITHFLTRNEHIDFVITLAVWEKQFGVLDWGERERRIDVNLVTKRNLPCAAALVLLRDSLFQRFPKPHSSGGNGRRQAEDAIYRWGFHGGCSMSDKSIKISLREMTELLAGNRTVADINELSEHRGRRSDSFPDRFQRLLQQGRLPVSVTIESGGRADDDWVEFTFGEPDPAISKFR